MTFPFYIALLVVNLGVLVFATIYIPRRLCGLFGVGKSRYFVLGFFLLIITGIVGIGAAAQTSNVLLLNLYKVAIIWLGFAFYLLTFLVLYELIRLFIKINKKKAGIGIMILSFAAVIYGSWNARSYEVIPVEIPIKGLKQEITIFHAPDVHLGPFRGEDTMRRLIDDINQHNPDFVLLNGDLVDGMDGLDEDVLALLKQSNSQVYFTGGNHDEYVDLPVLEELLSNNGVQVLRNDVIHWDGIQLVGLNYMNADDKVFDAHASSRTETIESVMPGLDLVANVPIIVAHHSPVGIEYMNKSGADLVLSGHTHAGQLFPATLIAQFQFKYLKGLYEFADTKIYVSQGVGTFGPPMRIGTQAEATLVKLVPEN